MENEDGYLISEFLDGSDAAFKELVEKYYQDAFAMAVYWTRNRESALDISQKAFIRIHENLFKIDVSKSFKAWLYTIVKNLLRGEIQEYTKLIAESRDQSMDRMISEAEKLGGNAIINVRFSTSYMMQSASEILVYGTAVVVE